MASVGSHQVYETLKVSFQDSICFMQIHRPEALNTINAQLVAECNRVLSECEEAATVIVLSGAPEVFCLGADFKEVTAASSQALDPAAGPGSLFDLWLRMA